MNRKPWWMGMLGSLGLMLVLATVAQACPTCKDTLAGDPAQQGLAKGIYYSILFMMSMPFFIFGSLCAYFYYLVRCDRADKARRGLRDSSPIDEGMQVPAAG
jgi:hypothetical protein